MSVNDTFFLGELLMRLECPDHQRFVQTEHFLNRYTGAELNSAVIMRCLGAKDLHLITAVPDNALGDAALNETSRWGISTDLCIRKPGRLGLFFLEQGFGVRPSSVIYDRANSVFAASRFEDYGFENLFRNGGTLYVSGTLPALAPHMPDFLEQVFACAKQNGCTVCFDLNYRSTLWSWERAVGVFRSLLKHVDILFGNESLAQAMFQIAPQKLCSEFSLKLAALTRREEPDPAENVCSAVLYDAAGNVFESKKYHAKMLDRIGGGDAFSGAVLFALQQKMDLQKAVDFAVAAQVLKQTVHGDFGLISATEVTEYLERGSAAVRR